MDERWSDEFTGRVREWCDAIGPLVVDALGQADLVARAEFGFASKIVADELFARLCVLDYPPVPPSLGTAPEG